MTAAKLRLARVAMADRETNVGDLCRELGITRQTLSIGTSGRRASCARRAKAARAPATVTQARRRVHHQEC